MKRIVIILVVAAMLTGLTACTGNTPANTGENVVATGKNEQTEPSVTDKTPSSKASETAQKTEETLPATERARDGATAAKESEPLTERKSVLVVFFSATGTTKGVAEKIAAIENADLYEIKAAKQYTSADLNYNDENSLACVVTVGYLAALDKYRITRESKAGKGYADFLFEPLKKSDTAIILELKYNHSAEDALRCIHERGYIQRFKDWHRVLLVGINYSERTKRHACLTELIEEKS